MKRAALALLAMTAAARAGETGPTFGPTFGSPYRFTEQGGEAIYRSVCSGCHMPDGGGATGAGTYPSLIDDQRLAAPDDPIGIVLKGRKAMPPFAHSLTDEQVAAVLNYVRTHFANAFTDPIAAADVAARR